MRYSFLLFLTVLFSAPVSAQPLQPVPFDRVEVRDPILAPWRERIHDATLPHAFGQLGPAVENMRLTTRYLAGVPDRMPVVSLFLASDLYKTMEAAAYSLAVTPDPALEARMDSIIFWIAGAQKPDGYMYEAHVCGVPDTSMMGEHPYERIFHSHELYNMGHLYEAAIAYHEATGKDNLLKIAEKHARHVNRAFFEGDPNYNGGEPIGHIGGHPEIELALAKMFRHTGDPLYRRMAERFVAIRGTDLRGADLRGGNPSELYRSQEHMPLKDMREPLGHAVCAAYIYTGMDMADAICGTHEYGEALESIWDNIMATRVAITGGLGAVRGIEGFGGPYDLPNKNSYNETCASVASVLLNDELFRNRREGKYIDALEVALYNGALAGINLAGDRFFYVNPLETDGIMPFNLGSRGRQPWYGCACCPPNIARLLMKAPGYMYYHTGNDIYFTLYGSSSTELRLGKGKVGVVQESDYPFSGTSRIVLTPEKPMQFTVRLRIPTWACGETFMPGGLYAYVEKSGVPWQVAVNGRPVEAVLEDGFAVIDRKWRPGDRVELTLPLQPRYVKARPEVEADRDRLAVVCGPLVYCAEEADNGLVQEYYLPGMSPLQIETMTDTLLGGLPAITLPADKLDTPDRKKLTLIPYYAWNNRGNASMIVWLPQTEPQARASLPVTHLYRSWLKEYRLTCNNAKADREAVFDGMTPHRSHHQGYHNWTSRGCEGEPQQLEFIFTGQLPVTALSVFWISDARTTTLLPESWSLEYLSHGEWHPFRHYVTDFYGLELDKFNDIRPREGELRCEGLRMTLQPQPGHSVGVAEIRIDYTR